MQNDRDKVREALKKAEFLYKKGMLDEAIEEFKALLRIDEKLVEAHYNLGNAFLKKEMLDEAKREYEEVLRTDPGHVNARYNLETVLIGIALRDSEKGAAVMECFGKGVFLSGEGMFDEAIKELKKALELEPNFVIAHIALGQSFAGKGMIDEAIKELRESVRMNPNYALAHYNLGLALAMKGLMIEAVKEFEETLRIDPGYPNAPECLKEAISSRGTVKSKATEHFLRADSLAREGLLDDAIKEYKKVLEISPDYIAAYNNLGAVFLEKGMVDEAIIEFEEALRIDPNIATVHISLGNALYRKKMVDEAIREYQKALKIEPNNVIAHINLGSLFFNEGMIDEAINEYKEALKNDPNNTIACNYLSSAMNKKKIEQQKIQNLPRDIEIEFEKFVGKKRGIKLDIVYVQDLNFQSIILLKPDRDLSTKVQAFSRYIKAKLLCEMPRAISSLKEKDLFLIRTTPTIVLFAEGKQFHEPGWIVKWRGYTIPLSFTIDWDEDKQIFLAGLFENPSKIERITSKEYQNQEFYLIKQIARAYLDVIKRIEI